MTSAWNIADSDVDVQIHADIRGCASDAELRYTSNYFILFRKQRIKYPCVSKQRLVGLSRVTSNEIVTKQLRPLRHIARKIH